ncbi:MAG: T9SS type A sorting domain-containing protein [Ignavibacteriales bacterium]|nr:T9SS type A sorting domain-containing protein [Ignavibacteriales bacterium]
MKLFYQPVIVESMLKTVVLFLLFTNSTFSFNRNEITDLQKDLENHKNNFAQDDTLFGNPPDANAVIFGKGIITLKDRDEYGLAVSPDLSEIFYTASGTGYGLMVMNKQPDGSWSTPKVANLRRNNSEEFEAFYTYDGSKVFFSYMVGEYDSKITYVEKTSDGYSTPVDMSDSPINSYSVFWSTLSKNNTMYFTNFTLREIYKSELVDGKYKEIKAVGLPNGSYHPFISPDEDLVLFDYNGDIFIAFIMTDGKFGVPIKLGSQINTSYWEGCSSLSPDGKYIFFSRYNDIKEKGDIYWARIDDAINSLRPTVDVKENKTEMPNEIQLYQNYPNPFNPITKIRWWSPVGSRQALKVYNVLGNKVITLLDEYKDAGTYEVEFSTRDGASELPSGLYFYQITSGGFSETRKMILLR